MDEIENKIDLEEAVEIAREMREFVGTPIGEKFFELLRDQYQTLVIEACRQSKFAGALQAIENLASHIGGSLSRGEAARERLERLKNESPVDDW